MKENFYYDNLRRDEGKKAWRGDSLIILNRPAFNMVTPVKWSDDPYQHRSWQWVLNNFSWMDRFIAEYKFCGNEQSMVTAKDYFLDWIKFSISEDNDYLFRWKDDAVSFRSRRLAVVTYWALHLHPTSQSERSALLGAAQLHLDELIDPRKFKRFNHGLFQMRGLLTLSHLLPELSGAHGASQYAVNRINDLWRSQYGSEGMHLENSPAYHLHILAEFEQILASPEFAGCDFVFTSEDVLEVKANMSYLVHPCGRGVMFGDTNLMELECPVVTGDRAFYESGYIVLAGQEKSKTNSFFILKAAFRSSAHKHSDDFTFEWSENGEVIITDSGRYSYDYEHPMRKFMTSPRAHNTVAVDDLHYPWWGEFSKDDFYYSAINSFSSNEQKSGFCVGRFFREMGVEFRRNVTFEKGKRLTIDDRLTAKKTHNFVQWFHFSPNFKLVGDDERLTVASELQRISIKPPRGSRTIVTRGQTTPYIQGFVSFKERQTAENLAVGFAINGAQAEFITSFEVSRIE